jgi:hypothetical protein
VHLATFHSTLAFVAKKPNPKWKVVAKWHQEPMGRKVSINANRLRLTWHVLSSIDFVHGWTMDEVSFSYSRMPLSFS